MKRPPRKLTDLLFNKRAFLLSLLQGLSVLAVVFIIFLLALYMGKGEAESRTLAFAALVFANLMLITTNLSWHQSLFKTIKAGNQALWFVLTAAILALMAVLYIPFLRDLFHFSVLHPRDLLITFLGGVISLIWFEGLKMVTKKPMEE